MAFRFKRREEFAAGVHRIASEQIRRALREWEAADRAVAVHETRKCIKRLRALLRLVKPVVPPQDYNAENAYLRDIGRSLSGSRDLQVMRDTIAELGKQALPEEAAYLGILSEQIDSAINSAQPETEPGHKKTAKALHEAEKRLAKVKLTASGFDVAGAGFERTYRQGRSRLADLSRMHTDEASHDWRKRVQAHWRQLALLRPAWPEFFDARIALARQLSEALGRDHDCAVLADYAAGTAAVSLGAEGVNVIKKMIDRKQEEIRRQTLNDGRLLFADKPKALTKQIRRYWQAAAAQSDGQKKAFKKAAG